MGFARHIPGLFPLRFVTGEVVRSGVLLVQAVGVSLVL